MEKWVCTVCGYVYEDESTSEKCSQCGVPASKFKEQGADKAAWACEHKVRVVQGVPRDIVMNLGTNLKNEYSEVGMYLAVSRTAHREGYPEVGMHWVKVVFEETEHAIKFAELLDEVVTSSTKKNLEMRMVAENGAIVDKLDLAKKAKALNLDVVHDAVHEMVKDEARHDRAFEGLLDRYFG